MKEKKLKIIFIIILILLLAIMIGSVIFYRASLSGNKLPDVKEILSYHGSEFIKEEKSSEKEYDYDIYAKLKFPPIEENGYAEETFYNNVVVDLTAKLQTNFRIIDEEKDIIVRVKYDFTTYNSYYSINNVDNYFKIQQAKVQNELANKDTIEININSEVLKSIVDSKWERRKASLGTIESNINKYDVYYDEGYSIRTLGINIYNIIFTTNYKNQIFNGITTGMNNEAVIQKLGTPTFTYSNNSLIGYKSNELYAFFYEGQVSIYEVAKLNGSSNRSFAELFTKLNKDGDITSFYNNLNILYPNPETSIENNDEISLFYPTLGLRVHFGKGNNGITIYSNFQGNITTDITMEDLKNGSVPPNTDLDIKTDAVFFAEKVRYLDEVGKRNAKNSWACATTSSYQVYDNNETHSFDFYSIDKKSIDSSINKNAGMKVLSLDDNRFVYNIPYDGIYLYNAQTLKTEKILQGSKTDELKLEKIENNVLYYDGKTLPIG